MASREKKLSTGRKQVSASPVPPKDAVATPETPSKASAAKSESPSAADDAAPKLTPVKPASPRVAGVKGGATKSTALAKKITKNVVKKAITKNLALNLKAKNRRPSKIKQQIAKAYLKNGVKPKRVRRTKAQIEMQKLLAKQQNENNPSPVVQPVPPPGQATTTSATATEKKPVKKRVKKIPADSNTKKVKVNTSNNYSSIDDTINSILSQIVAEEEQKVTRKPKIKKPKAEAPVRDTVSETIEDVMKDLSYLIKNEDIKQEPDVLSESGKTDVKQKKPVAKKIKTDVVKKKAIKKESENALSKRITLDASAKHLIDILDLSIHKTNQIVLPTCNRRHSIEKFPIDALENPDLLNTVSVFNSLPSTIMPKSKRVSKSRQSVDAQLCLKRYSPYSTRSDSPAQILRNGKHRRMKDSSLFDGLDSIIKRRRRLCSDFSGSEKSVSKLSGYESDSSFSDKASCYGADNVDQKDGPFKFELKKEVDTSSQTQAQDSVNIKSVSDKRANIVKRSLSTDPAANGIAEDSLKNDQNFMDSNSNLCNDIKSEMPLENETEFPENLVGTPSSKVPEKSIILDIMKQAFNDVSQEDPERRTTRSTSKKSVKSDEDRPKNVTVSTSKFYGVTNQQENECEKTEAAETENADMDTEKVEESLQKPAQPEVQLETGANADLTLPKDDACQDSPKKSAKPDFEETPENLAIKENILQALGLQSLKAAEQAKIKGKAGKNDYTGTLKTVIKLNRCEKKKGRNSLKTTLQKKNKMAREGDVNMTGAEDETAQKGLKESASTSWRSHAAQSSDTAGALRKSHYSNRSNMDGSSEHTSDGDTAAAEGEDGGKVLVIPEKASSFSIHPGRLCKDECSYCFGKFGLFDTPCHIAQMKSVERQDKILEAEKHLTRDSCLCDACYRHVDRKSNTPSYLNKGSKRSGMVAPGPRQNHCHVLGCNKVSSNILRRKWIIKMRKSVCQVARMKRQDLSVLERSELLKKYDALPRCSQRIAARKLEITQSTLSRLLQQREKIRESIANNENLNRKRKRDGKDAAVEARLLRWFKGVRWHSRPVGRRILLERAAKFAASLGRENFRPTDGWLSRWKERNNINIDLDNPGLHSIPICSEHYLALEHLMICAICKRRLARNHIHYLGPESNDLNAALNTEGIPVKLIDKPVVCKLCRYFASLVLKSADERSENTNEFFRQYKKRLLHFHDVEVMDDAAAEEPIPVPTKEKLEKEPIKRRKKLQKTANSSPVHEQQIDGDKQEQSRVPSDSNSTGKSRSESPSDYMVDYHTLIPSIAMECGSDVEGPKRDAPKMTATLKRASRADSIIKEAVEMSKAMKFKNNCDSLSKNSAIAVQRLGSNPCISVRQLFPGEEEMGLQGSIDFGNVKEKTPEGWEKFVTTIQCDNETKILWQELQKPYGNLSSFLRHLILLEKYFRNGDLVLAPNASHHSINYSESVQNRLHAYDNIPTSSYAPFTVKKSSSGIVTTKDTAGPSVSIINAANIPKNTPITIAQLSNLTPATSASKSRNPGVPPGLISLHPGTTRPTAPALIKVPQPQKIKIPLTKNWRPNLIPIDPSKKSDKKPGFVKVISAGKPYHITVDDYNRMCAIKKSYDLKQKRIMEAQAANAMPSVSVTQNSTILKTLGPRKGLTISSKTATITSPKSDHSLSDGMDTESNLEKLDRTVENLETKLSESTSMMNLPKIPKSLTVIPQTVTHKPSRPSSPALMITTKPKPSTSKS